MLFIIYVLFILLIIIYIYYKTYENTELVIGESFINRDNSLEELGEVKQHINSILDNHYGDYPISYTLEEVIEIQKTFNENKTHYNTKVKLVNSNDLLLKKYNITYTVDNNNNILSFKID